MISFFGVLYRLFLAAQLVLSYWRSDKYYSDKVREDKIKTVGFFHPPAFFKGGSEKVLWGMIEHYQNIGLEVHLFYFTPPWWKVAIEYEVADINRIFGLNVKADSSLIIHLVSTDDFNSYSGNPVYQTFGFFLFNLHAIDIFEPDLIIDNYSGSFASYAFKLLRPKSRVIKLIHTWNFRIAHEENTFNKLIEVGPLEKKWYRFTGYFWFKLKNMIDIFSFKIEDIIFVFVSKFHKEIHAELLQIKGNFTFLYPRANINEMYLDPKDWDEKKEKILVSFGQYRPDKMHHKQLLIFKQHIDEFPNSDLKFIMVGSTSPLYEAYLAEVKAQVTSLNLEGKVEVLVDQSTNQLKQILARASLGLHLCNEALGIAVVEMMAAGVPILGANYGGVKYDLLGDGAQPTRGFLSNIEGIAQYLNEFTANYDNPEYKQKLRNMAKASQDLVLKEFNQKKFEETLNSFLTKFDSK